MSSQFAFQMERGLGAEAMEYKIVSFGGGTDSEVAAMLDAAADGLLDLSTVWSVGDVRTITVGEFVDGAGTTHEEQEIDIVISSFDDYEECGCLMQFDFKDALATAVRMNSENTNVGGYDSTEMYTTTLPALVEAMPSWMKERMVEFNVKASEGNKSSTIETISGNKLALRSEIEVFGSNTSSILGEGSQIEYYQTAANRVKKRGHSGSVQYWEERSPVSGSSNGFCGVNSNGSASLIVTSNAYGVAPFGCLGGNQTHIYGAYWDGGSDPSWTRTDNAADFDDPNPYYSGMATAPSSPFDDCYPWNGMEVVEDAEAGTLVSIPKFWYKWTRDDLVTGDMKLQIADGPVEGFLVSPAHQDRGDDEGERDIVYVGKYNCSSSNYKSVSGATPKVSITRPTARTNIHNLGSTIWQWDYAMYWTICMLYLVEYANWNSQAKVGYGRGNGSSVQKTGNSSQMPYHTGTTQATLSTYGLSTQYRYIEDLWGNTLDFVDGIYFNGANIYAIKNPANFSDSAGGTLVGTRAVEPQGQVVVKSWTNVNISDFEYCIYPSKTISDDGSFSTYSCDAYGYDSNANILYVGDFYNQDQWGGLFRFDGTRPYTHTDTNRSIRLMKLPSNS